MSLNRLARWLLYRMDPDYRRLADSKRGGLADDLGVNERLIIVRRRAAKGA